MGSADTRAAALLLFSLSAVLLVVQRSPGLADLMRSALELATRRNMILLCHAILLVILRDAGLLGARRRSSASPADDAPARPRAHVHACTTTTTTTTVVWRRRPRNRPAAPARLTESPSCSALVVEEPPVATKQVALVVESPSCSNKDGLLVLDHPARAGTAAIVHVQQPDKPTATAMGSEGDHEKTEAADSTAPEQEMELADDRAFEEFIRSQRRKMRQESLRLARAPPPVQADSNSITIGSVYNN